jgi:hypothetical protein
MKKKLDGTWKISIRYWPVQINGNKFATGQIPKKPVEVVKGRILAGWAQKSPEPCSKFRNHSRSISLRFVFGVDHCTYSWGWFQWCSLSTIHQILINNIYIYGVGGGVHFIKQHLIFLITTKLIQRLQQRSLMPHASTGKPTCYFFIRKKTYI